MFLLALLCFFVFVFLVFFYSLYFCIFLYFFFFVVFFCVFCVFCIFVFFVFSYLFLSVAFHWAGVGFNGDLPSLPLLGTLYQVLFFSSERFPPLMACYDIITVITYQSYSITITIFPVGLLYYYYCVIRYKTCQENKTMKVNIHL